MDYRRSGRVGAEFVLQPSPASSCDLHWAAWWRAGSLSRPSLQAGQSHTQHTGRPGSTHTQRVQNSPLPGDTILSRSAGRQVTVAPATDTCAGVRGAKVC